MKFFAIVNGVLYRMEDPGHDVIVYRPPIPPLPLGDHMPEFIQLPPEVLLKCRSYGFGETRVEVYTVDGRPLTVEEADAIERALRGGKVAEWPVY